MDDFPGLLARDFGFRPQGKSAPMSAAKSSSIGSRSASARSTNPLDPFDDVFGGPSKFSNANSNRFSPPPAYDSIFDDLNPNPNPNPNPRSMPVYDKPVYDDDDIFDGVAGIKASSGKVEYEDVFASIPTKKGHVDGTASYNDLLGSLGRSSSSARETKRSEDLGGFDDLLPGFGGSSSPPSKRNPLESNQQNSYVPSAEPTATMPEDPFVVLERTSSPYSSSGMSGTFTDPLENLGKPIDSTNANADASPVNGGIFDDVDGFGNSIPAFASEKNQNQKERSPPPSRPDRTQERSTVESFDNVIPKTRSPKSIDSRSGVRSPNSNESPSLRNATVDQVPRFSEHLETADDVWLTVSEVPLYTQPTSAPPPSRRPPPLVIRSSQYGRTDPKAPIRRPRVCTVDELEDFYMNKPHSNEHTGVLFSEDDTETNSSAAASAAAMKDAMNKAEAKFRHAKEVREREQGTRPDRSRDFTEHERDEEETSDLDDVEKYEKLERERLQREREEREREKRRLELEREKARQAVERATREARERAAADARAKAERAAVDKVNAEARKRAERAAVQRAATEARERAAFEARQKAERAAAEARERASAEAREKAATERERAAAEARLRAERAAANKAHAEARERAAAAARANQHKAEDDLESFFGMGSRPNSAPKQRATTTENIFDTQTQGRGTANGTQRSSSTSSSTMRKASSTTNIVDDLTSIFGGAPSSGEFQEVEGESEERRRARLERHQRTLERAAKALAEKNERDMQTQREQAERHRIAETLDIEIKRWAAGKEGNLRALLSTMQYVLWPECGWQPVSLTDMITAAAVRKVYRKANLCIHPDKVQQKGANLQQKYIAEKVFDLLKEAWNKFNSEELF